MFEPKVRPYSSRERREGATSVEYTILLSLIAIGSFGTISMVGRQAMAVFNSVNSAVASQSGTASTSTKQNSSRSLLRPDLSVGQVGFGSVTTQGRAP